MKKNLKIISTADGVENSLVLVHDTDLDIYYASLQKSKYITKTPKIDLVTDKINLVKFLKKVSKELASHTCPKLNLVTELHCNCFCELLRIYKIDTYEYEVQLYYNHRRPRTKKCVDSVSLTNTDLERFIEKSALI